MFTAFTHHARTRMQQRGIPLAAVDALLDFGSARYLHSKGREVVFFDKAARTRLSSGEPSGGAGGWAPLPDLCGDRAGWGGGDGWVSVSAGGPGGGYDDSPWFFFFFFGCCF